MPDLPLDEAALHASSAKLGEKLHWLKDIVRTEELAKAAISTYLTEAGFEVEKRGGMQRDPKRKGFSVYVDAEQRLVGPWLPVNKQEGE